MVYAFNGFQVLASFASEIENPKRNIPLAMIISILFTLAVYLLLQFAFMASMPADIAAKGWSALDFSSPLVQLTMLLGMNFMAILLVADSIASPSVTGMTYMGSCSRMLYAMADQGQMPKWIAKICPKHNLSKRSLFINLVLCILILLNSDSWAALMVIGTAFNVLGYMGAPIALAVLNRRTRIYTTFVFVILALLLSTLSLHDAVMSNLAITIMVAIYALIQMYQKRFTVHSILFVVFLWLLLLTSTLTSYIGVIILAIAFFWFFTSQYFVTKLQITNPSNTPF